MHIDEHRHCNISMSKKEMKNEKRENQKLPTQTTPNGNQPQNDSVHCIHQFNCYTLPIFGVLLFAASFVEHFNVHSSKGKSYFRCLKSTNKTNNKPRLIKILFALSSRTSPINQLIFLQLPLLH